MEKLVESVNRTERVGTILKKENFFIASETDDYYAEDEQCSCCGSDIQRGWSEKSVYGYKLATGQSYHRVTVKDGNYFFGGKKVHGYKEYMKPFDADIFEVIFKWYQIRTKNENGYTNYCCGFDLLPDGQFWVGYLNRREKDENAISGIKTTHAGDKKFHCAEEAVAYIDDFLGKDKWDFYLEEEQRL
jgi:hypothetical protein